MASPKQWSNNFDYLFSIVGNLPPKELMRLYGRLLKYTLPSRLWAYRGSLGLTEEVLQQGSLLGMAVSAFIETNEDVILRKSAINNQLQNWVGLKPSGGNTQWRRRRIEKLRRVFRHGISAGPARDEALEAIDRLASLISNQLLG
jgi:hypothetical protein